VAVLISTVVPQRLRPRCRSVAGLRLRVLHALSWPVCTPW
jgi:hypothetical protein